MTNRQRQRLFRGGLYALFVAVLGGLAFVADWGAIQDNFFQVDVARQMLPEVLTLAARNTLIYTVLSFIFGLGIGLVLALMKLSPVAPYRIVASAYIEFFRGLPALLTIIFFAFAIPIAFDFRLPGGTIGAGLVGLAVVAGAYMAETIRAGIEAVPPGQMEAARSLGMSQGRAMVSIVLPQAFRIIIPPMTNEFVLLIKDTSLFFVIGTQPITEELTKFGRDELFNAGNGTPLVVVGIAYLMITIPLTQLVAVQERRNRRER